MDINTLPLQPLSANGQRQPSSDFHAVQQWLDAMLPDREQASFRHWYAKAKPKYAEDPYFYRKGQEAGSTLLYTILKWIYGNVRN